MAMRHRVLSGLLLLAFITCCSTEVLPHRAGARHLAQAGAFDPHKVQAFCTAATPANINAAIANPNATNDAITSLLALFGLTASSVQQLPPATVQEFIGVAYSLCIVIDCYGLLASLPSAVSTNCPASFVTLLQQDGAAATSIVSSSASISTALDFNFTLSAADVDAICNSGACRTALNSVYQSVATCITDKTQGVNIGSLSSNFTSNGDLSTASSCQAALSDSGSASGGSTTAPASNAAATKGPAATIATPSPATTTTPAATKTSNTTTSGGAKLAMNAGLVAMGCVAAICAIL